MSFFRTAFRNKSFTDIIYILSTLYLGVILGAVRGFLFAKFLGPYYLGINNSLALIQQYGTNSNLGLQQGMTKLFPISRNKGNIEESYQYRDQSFSLTIIFTTALVFVGVITTWTFFHHYSLIYKIGATAYLLDLILYQYFIFYSGLSKSLLKFKVASSAKLILTASYVLFGIILVYYFSIWGVFIAILIKYIFTFIVFKKIGESFNISFKFNKRILLNLFKHGLILTALNLLITFIFTIDRIYIIKYFSIIQLGYYGFALTFSTLVVQFTSSISSFIYPVKRVLIL